MSERSTRPAGAGALDLGGLDEALGFQLRLLEQAVLRSFARLMDPLEVTPTLYSILVVIEANPGCRQTELSQALNMHQPNLVERVGLLLSRGLIVRREDPSDRRANVLELSFAGRHFMEKLQAAHEAHLEDLRQMLGADRYQALMDLTRDPLR